MHTSHPRRSHRTLVYHFLPGIIVCVQNSSFPITIAQIEYYHTAAPGKRRRNEPIFKTQKHASGGARLHHRSSTRSCLRWRRSSVRKDHKICGYGPPDTYTPWKAQKKTKIRKYKKRMETRSYYLLIELLLEARLRASGISRNGTFGKISRRNGNALCLPRVERMGLRRLSLASVFWTMCIFSRTSLHTCATQKNMLI